jgi:hypothetical protein
MTTMLLRQWTFVALAVLTVLVTLRLRRRPPSLPPLASLQGIPAELRNQVYELVAIEPSTRFISGRKLVASYQTLHNQRSPKFERTSLKWYVSEMPMANIKVPIIDAAPILPSATARHALSNASHQLRAEFRHFEQQVSASEYLFVLDNFDLKQMELIARLHSRSRQRGTLKGPAERHRLPHLLRDRQACRSIGTEAMLIR